ncbi:radical SAM/SPASM domain-containing protein [Paenibacillus tengchongensis]|uniref:radical SAM/SPASM domain-containing protein n=1 Tax=Paenibacillus tengchongensis TaxID=2608684 RepID=UPI00124D752F|nr:radical SAM protein [Paenibacillus tengchongensis]
MKLYQAKPSLLLVDQAGRNADAPAGLPLFPSYYVRDTVNRRTVALEADIFQLLTLLIQPTSYAELAAHYGEEELQGILDFLNEQELLSPGAPAAGSARLLRSGGEAHLQGIPLAPRTVMINCTPKCNLRCKHCIVSDKHYKQQDILSLDDMRGFLDDLDAYGVENLVLSGGEPLLWQSIYEIMEDSLNRSYTVVLYTNGMLINEKWLTLFRRIQDHKPGGLKLHVSLDGGTPQTHDSIRGVKGSFQRITASLEVLSRRGIPVAAVESMATADLYPELEALISVCRQYHVHSLYLHPVFNFDGNPQIQELELDMDTRVRFLQRMSELSAGSPGVELRYSDPYFPAGLFQEGQSRPRSAAEEFLNRILSGDHTVIGEYEVKPRDPAVLMNCDGGTSQMFVDYNGDVYPCMIYANSGKPVDHCGNVTRNSLPEVWNSEGMNRVRKVNTREELTVCGKCDYFDRCGPAVKKCRIASEIALGDFMGPSYLCVKYAAELGIAPQLLASYQEALPK